VKESQVCTELVRSLNDVPNTFCYKIPDVGRRSTHRFIPARVYDLIVCHESKMVAIEIKHIKGPLSVNKSRITEFEDRSLMAVENAGGASFLLLCYWFYPTERQREKWDLPRKVKRIYYQRYYKLKKLFDKYGRIPYSLIRRFPHVDYDRGWAAPYLDQLYDSNQEWTPFKIRIKNGKSDSGISVGTEETESL